MLPIVSTSIIGVVGAYIAWQQWSIAEIRLRLDTYERKFRIYEAAKTILAVFELNATISIEEYFTYLRGITDAEFIFDDPNVTQYLQKLREQTVELMRSQKQGAVAADQSSELEHWFSKQFDVLKSKFQPSMSLHQPSISEKIREGLDALTRSYRRGFGKSNAPPVGDAG